MGKPDPSDPFSNLAFPKPPTFSSFPPIPLVPFVLLSCQVRKWQKSDLALQGGFPREERSSLVREERRAAITPLSGLPTKLEKSQPLVVGFTEQYLWIISVGLSLTSQWLLLLVFQRRPRLPHDARAEQARGVEEGRLGARQGPRQR